VSNNDSSAKTSVPSTDWSGEWEPIDDVIRRQLRQLYAAGGITRIGWPCGLNLKDGGGQLLLHPWADGLIEVRGYPVHPTIGHWARTPVIITPPGNECHAFHVSLPTGRLRHVDSGLKFYAGEVRLRAKEPDPAVSEGATGSTEQPTPESPAVHSVEPPSKRVPVRPSFGAADDDIAEEVLRLKTSLPVPPEAELASLTRCPRWAAQWLREKGNEARMLGAGTFETKRRRLRDALRRRVRANTAGRRGR
jgi:hypothetical protein